MGWLMSNRFDKTTKIHKESYSDDAKKYDIIYGVDPLNVAFQDRSIARTWPISSWTISITTNNINAFGQLVSTFSLSSDTNLYLDQDKQSPFRPIFSDTWRYGDYYITLSVNASTTNTSSEILFAQTVKVAEFEPFANFYAVSAATVSSNFCTDTDNITSLQNINVIPNATHTDNIGVTFNFISGYAPNLTVYFKDTSEAHTFPISSYHWDFGDPFNEGPTDITSIYSNYYTITNTNILSGNFNVPCWKTNTQGHTAVHTYIMPGTYDVTLTVRASNTSTSDICAIDINDRRFSIYVEEIPPRCVSGIYCSLSAITGFTNAASSISGVSPVTAYFHSSSIAAGSFPIHRIDWDFGDGNIQHIVRRPLTTTTSQGLPVINISAYPNDLEDPRNIVVPYTYTNNTEVNQNFNINLSAYACNTNTMIHCSAFDLVNSITPEIRESIYNTKKLIGSRFDDSGNLIYILEGDVYDSAVIDPFPGVSSYYISDSSTSYYVTGIPGSGIYISQDGNTQLFFDDNPGLHLWVITSLFLSAPIYYGSNTRHDPIGSYTFNEYVVYVQPDFPNNTSYDFITDPENINLGTVNLTGVSKSGIYNNDDYQIQLSWINALRVWSVYISELDEAGLGSTDRGNPNGSYYLIDETFIGDISGIHITPTTTTMPPIAYTKNLFTAVLTGMAGDTTNNNIHISSSPWVPLSSVYPYDDNISINNVYIQSTDGYNVFEHNVFESSRDVSLNKNTVFYLTSAKSLFNFINEKELNELALGSYIVLSTTPSGSFGSDLQYITVIDNNLYLGTQYTNNSFFRFIANNDNTFSLLNGSDLYITVDDKTPFNLTLQSKLPETEEYKQKFNWYEQNGKIYFSIKIVNPMGVGSNYEERFWSFSKVGPERGRIRASGILSSMNVLSANNDYLFNVSNFDSTFIPTGLIADHTWISYYNQFDDQHNNKTVEPLLVRCISGVYINHLFDLPYNTKININNRSMDVNFINLKNIMTGEYEYKLNTINEPTTTPGPTTTTTTPGPTTTTTTPGPTTTTTTPGPTTTTTPGPTTTTTTPGPTTTTTPGPTTTTTTPGPTTTTTPGPTTTTTPGPTTTTTTPGPTTTTTTTTTPEPLYKFTFNDDFKEVWTNTIPPLTSYTISPGSYVNDGDWDFFAPTPSNGYKWLITFKADFTMWTSSDDTVPNTLYPDEYGEGAAFIDYA
jgi:hypothetical protein